MTAVLFVGAVQLVCVGVLGEYVGQVLEELRHRPLYVVDNDTGVPARARATAEPE
jgi:dolichol-phosphate mannosyltransferase